MYIRIIAEGLPGSQAHKAGAAGCNNKNRWSLFRELKIEYYFCFFFFSCTRRVQHCTFTVVTRYVIKEEIITGVIYIKGRDRYDKLCIYIYIYCQCQGYRFM